MSKKFRIIYILNILIIIFLSAVLIRWYLWYIDIPHRILFISLIDEKLTLFCLVAAVILFIFNTLKYIRKKN